MQGTLLKQLLFYDPRMWLKTCQALPAKEQGLAPAAWPQPPEDLGCQEQKSWQWSSYAILPGTTCACTASRSIKRCCQQHRCWHQLVATVEAINVSKLKSPGKPQPGKSLLLLGEEPIPCNTQQNALQLTLQSTVLRICLSESLLTASAGFGWVTMCWRLDLAIAFLEDTGGLAIRSGEEECKTQPVSGAGGEAGAEKHPQDQASGNEVNPQHRWPRSTCSCKAALWDKEVLAMLLMAQLKTPFTWQKAQPGPPGPKPLGMTGPLQNSLGCSTELWWCGCLCRDNPEPLPHRGSPQLSHSKAPQSLGRFWEPAQLSRKKAAVFWGLASFSRMC